MLDVYTRPEYVFGFNNGNEYIAVDIIAFNGTITVPIENLFHTHSENEILEILQSGIYGTKIYIDAQPFDIKNGPIPIKKHLGVGKTLHLNAFNQDRTKIRIISHGKIYKFSYNKLYSDKELTKYVSPLKMPPIENIDELDTYLFNTWQKSID